MVISPNAVQVWPHVKASLLRIQQQSRLPWVLHRTGDITGLIDWSTRTVHFLICRSLTHYANQQAKRQQQTSHLHLRHCVAMIRSWQHVLVKKSSLVTNYSVLHFKQHQWASS